jgi:hypothetical protein
VRWSFRWAEENTVFLGTRRIGIDTNFSLPVFSTALDGDGLAKTTKAFRPPLFDDRTSGAVPAELFLLWY